MFQENCLEWLFELNMIGIVPLVLTLIKSGMVILSLIEDMNYCVDKQITENIEQISL